MQVKAIEKWREVATNERTVNLVKTKDDLTEQPRSDVHSKREIN